MHSVKLGYIVFEIDAELVVLMKSWAFYFVHYRKEFVSVGVTKQENSFKQEIDENDAELIWERILQYVPSLKV